MPNSGYSNNGRTAIMNNVRRSRNWSRTSRQKIRRTLFQFMARTLLRTDTQKRMKHCETTMADNTDARHRSNRLSTTSDALQAGERLRMVCIACLLRIPVSRCLIRFVLFRMLPIVIGNQPEEQFFEVAFGVAIIE